MVGDVGLGYVYRATLNQFLKPSDITFMLTRRNRNDFLGPKLPIGNAIFDGKRLLDPSDAKWRNIPGKSLDRGGRIGFVAHPPPGVRIKTKSDFRANRLPHKLDRPEVFLRSKGRAVLVGFETKLANSRGFLRILLRRTVHPGAAIAGNGFLPASAEELRYRTTFGFSLKIQKRDFE